MNDTKEKTSKNTKDIFMPEKSILLSLLSSSSRSRNEMISVVDALYKQFNSLYEIMHSTEKELSSVLGLSRRNAQILRLIPSVLEKYLKSKILSKKNDINTYKEVLNYFKLTLRNLKFEMFMCAVFDINKNVVLLEDIFHGSISSATIYPREIVEIALNNSGVYLMVAHNHPSGIAEPSDDDIELTEALCKICLSVDISLVDHLIITKNEKYSFKTSGMIRLFKENFLENKYNKNQGGYYA